MKDMKQHQLLFGVIFMSFMVFMVKKVSTKGPPDEA